MNGSDHAQDGYTIVEVLVAIVMFSIVSVGLYQVLIAQTGVAERTRAIGQVADEARLGFNRMVRDVREADAITWISPSGNQFTINVNFDGDAYYSNPNTGGDDEILTYTYDPLTDRVTLCSATVYSSCNSSNTEVLMAGVRPVGGVPVFTYTSSNLEYDWGNDAGGPPNGVTSWRELDEASGAAYNIVGVGNDNDTLDAGEFPFLNTISFALRLPDGDRAGNCPPPDTGTCFYSRVQMRNKL